MMAAPIHSLTINGRITLDLHALNNEGAEGNQLQTRMVQIVDGNGQLVAVNAISGDMFKHMFAEAFREVALASTDIPLCDGCRVLDANRIMGDPEFREWIEGPAKAESINDSAVLDRVLRSCALDDVAGILITAGGRSIGRKSCVEFGWVVGVPETTRTESYIHVKYVPEGRGAGSAEAANLGQNLFYRPASSGEYAVVVNLDVSKIGQNDITLGYAIDAEQRQARARAAVEALLHTFLKPTGAHRNTQNPHIAGFKGVVAWSASPVPAPTVSPLNDAFPSEIERIAEALNKLRPDSVTIRQFDSQSGFAHILADVIPGFETAAAGGA